MEELNDILGYNLKIYQRKDWFSFSLDSVILANFATINFNVKRILDLGTGNGIIPLILSLRTNAKIIGVDIQQDLIDLANKSACYNNLEKQLSFKCYDIKKLFEYDKDSYDLILCNPPYFKNYQSSDKNLDIHKTIARHEVLIELEDIVSVASKFLKEGGKFALINRTDRMIEIINLFKKYKIEPKKVRFIHKNSATASTMFFIEGMKLGRPGLKVDNPLFVYNLDGSNSLEYDKLCREVL